MEGLKKSCIVNDFHQGNNFMVMELELADGGDLHTFLTNTTSPLQEITKKNWCLHLLLGLQVLHEANIVHRDVSAKNVLLFGVGEAATLKITDFGLARDEYKFGFVPFSYDSADRPINICYAPPEFLSVDPMIGRLPRNKKSDIWSLGVVFYFMEECKLPFDSESTEGGNHAIASQIIQYGYGRQKLPLFARPFSIPGAVVKSNRGSLRDMARKMMDIYPHKRPDVQRLIQDKFIWPDRSIQIVDFAKDGQLVVKTDALDKIAKLSPLTIGMPAVIVTICGTFRTGKSLIMSLFVRYLELLEEFGDHQEVIKRLPLDERPLIEFRALTGTTATTHGVFMWSRAFEIKKSDGQTVAVYLVDTEGTRSRVDGKDTTEITDRDYRTLILAAILSSIQLYNVKGVINQNDIADIQRFSEFLMAMARQTDGKAADRKLLQSLVFLLRDFEETEDIDNEVFGFEPAMKQTQRNKAGFNKLEPYFEGVNFYAMPEPNKRVKNKRQFDDKLKVSDLNDDYNNFVLYAAELFRWSVETAKPLSRGRMQDMDFKKMKKLLTDYVRTMNQSPGNLQPMCEAVSKIEHDEAVKSLYYEYGRRLQEEDALLIKKMELFADDNFDCSSYLESFKQTHETLKTDILSKLLNMSLPMKHHFMDGCKEDLISCSQKRLEEKIDVFYKEMAEYHETMSHCKQPV